MIYKYFKANEYSISTLIRNEFFCQNYRAFNDPFECWFTLKHGIPHPKKEFERFEAVCKAWGYNYSEPADEDQGYFEYMEELEGYQPNLEGYIEAAKISCFSQEIDNLLMWAHYADGFRGFCIEYDETQILLEDKEKEAVIIPVSYAKKPPVIDKIIYALAVDQIWYNETALGEEPQGKYVKDYKEDLRKAEKLVKDLYRKTIATKPSQWKYEKEVRLIFDSKNSSSAGEFFRFPANSIKSVVFGEKMDIKMRETLSQIVDMKNLPIKKKVAKRETDNYRVKLETFD
jgi:hypothetical protein